MAEAGLAHVPACRAPRQPSAPAHLACRPTRHAIPRASRLGPALRRSPARRSHTRRPWQNTPAAWRPYAVDAVARHSRPAPAPTRPPTSAEAGALSCSLPRCLSSPQAPSSLTLPLAAPPHPPAKFTVPSPPRPAIARQQFRLALRHVVLALVPTDRAQVVPSSASPPSAMAPPCSAAVEGTFLLFSNLPSYLPAFASFS
ncbi:uncharacterized protein [Miscanthus floridulus]|uniref:uncharacterized protein n=1 Tax=Miscanthus floridulus TaxID=154761 RepID=UPI0034582D50